MADMTKRMAMNAVVNGEVTAEVIEFFQAELVKMDEANAKRRAKTSAKVKDLTVAKAIAEVVNASEAPMTASDLVVALTGVIEGKDGKDLSVQFVSANARKAVDAGLIEATEVKVKGKGKQKAYMAIEAVEAVAEDEAE